MGYAFAIEPSASEADIAAVRAGLQQFNQLFASLDDAGPLNIFLRDAHDTQAGGLRARPWDTLF